MVSPIKVDLPASDQQSNHDCAENCKYAEDEATSDLTDEQPVTTASHTH